MKNFRYIIAALLVAFCAVSGMAKSTSKQTEEISLDDNQRFWRKDSKELRIGYTMGNMDRGIFYGGKIDSRLGVSLDMMRNIYLHRKAIGGFMKVGLQFGLQVNYLNYEKGHGSLSFGSIFGGEEEDDPDYDYGYDDDYNYDDEGSIALGTHGLNMGIGIGPTLTFMPFHKSSNANLARLKFRAYFNAVPSWSAFIISSDDEMKLHNAFTCLYAGGFSILWRKLDIGFQYKGGRVRYKDLVQDIMNGEMGNPWVGRTKNPRYGTNMYTISIGLVF
ncbi:MAG: hypothetical protein HDS65_08585 [Bacteroidales bacterium]|nr:hypothetical protein [Bacteroidales bacterium]